jgi:ubiquinone/menaquinone biosynthesis C-methylase UbiE
MKKTGNLNINTKFYWDYAYANSTFEDSIEREANRTEKWVFNEKQGRGVRPTKRFITALTFVKDGDKVLDIGCGWGHFIELVIEKYPFNEVWGVDISTSVIERNKAKNDGGIYYQQYVGHMDKVPDNYFDVVFSGEVLEHMDDPADLIKDACRVLKTGGSFVLTTPLGRSVDSSEHIWYFEKDDIYQLFSDNGFTEPKFVELPNLEKALVIFAVGEKK